MNKAERLEKRKAYQREWAEQNKERLRAYNREYQRKLRAENPEYHREAMRKHYEKHRERRKAAARESYRTGKRRNTYLAKRYGVSTEWYEQTLTAQSGKCAICECTNPGGRGERFHIDHCHVSGKARGLLCSSCNHALGNARDEVRILQAAAAYLVRHLHLKSDGG